MTTNSAELKLLNCPFCGGEPILNHIEPHSHKLMFNGKPIMDDYPGSWTIECCDVGMIKDTRDEVVTAWNRRTAAQGESKADEPKCGCCGGTGRMVRDPDIGTDQECFACDGTGRGEDDQAGSTEQVSEREAFGAFAAKEMSVHWCAHEEIPSSMLRHWKVWQARAALASAPTVKDSLQVQSAPERKVMTDEAILKLADDFGIDYDGSFYRNPDEDKANLLEFVRASLNQQGEQTAPEGFVIVPKEPTVKMIVAGFETVDAFQQTDQYPGLSGCAGAFESARICYNAMIAAAQSISDDGWISVKAQLPPEGKEVLINGQEGIEIATYCEAEQDSIDEMGHDAGWIGYKFAIPGRSFGNPDYMREPQGQPTHWRPLPAAPSTAQKDGGME